MSHEVAEIVIPPTTDVPAAIRQVMDDLASETDENNDRVSDWFDWWTVGGRFSGRKLQASLDKDAFQRFKSKLAERKVTVSGILVGKPELSPPRHIPVVDALWREMFPGKGERCPLFAHARNEDDFHADDVCRVVDLPERLTAARLIVATPHCKDKARLYARSMLATTLYNGVEWQKTDWDGNVRAGLERIVADWRRCPNREIPQLDDWLCVTVDCHH